MRQRSIARRLIATVLLLELVAAVGIIGIAMGYERHSHLKNFDVMLRGRADSLLGAVGDNEANDEVVLDLTGLVFSPGDMYEVRETNGNLLGQSKNWKTPDIPSADGIFRSRAGEQRFRFLREHGVRIVDPGNRGGGKRHDLVVIYGSSTEQMWNSIDETVGFYAIASSLLLIATGLVMAWLMNREMAPLRELALQAEGVSAKQWRFHPPESARAAKELAPLTLALEAVVQRLQHSFSQQEQFLGDAAHELKTAVALVKSSVQVLSIRPRSPQEYTDGLEQALIDCERMEAIVAKMLTLARIEAQPQESGVATDLGQCARQIARDFSSMAELRGVAVALHEEGQAWVRLSMENCSLVLGNLLLNSIQHSSAGTTVRIMLHARGEWVELRVVDQGSGIEPEALAHLFERFYRGDPSRNRNTGGTGLGLPICKAVVDKAGGTIEIESLQDMGTTVLVRIPKADEVILREEPAEIVTAPSV